MAKCSKGRCAGCGRLGSARVVSAHVVVCGDYLALYKADPAKALEPELEYQRWLEADAEADRIAAKQVRVGKLIADNESKIAAQVARWATPKDILED